MLFPFHDDNPTQRWPVVTVSIIVINTVCLLYMNGLAAQPGDGDYRLRMFVHEHGFIPARLAQLSNPLPLRINMYPGQIVRPDRQFIVLPPSARQIALSSVTAMFLHGGWYHLISNMWFFWLFGNNIEDRLGHVTFLLFYLVGGLVATACHVLMVRGAGTADPIIGASGAVAVILGAYAVFYPFARIHTLVFIIIFFTVIELPALVVLGFWFVGQLLSGLQALHLQVGTQVAWWAHIGGFLAGAVAMPLLAAGSPEPGAPPVHAAFRVRRSADRLQHGPE
jgi:membrane associated rhomboid family serine protease